MKACWGGNHLATLCIIGAALCIICVSFPPGVGVQKFLAGEVLDQARARCAVFRVRVHLGIINGAMAEQLAAGDGIPLDVRANGKASPKIWFGLAELGAKALGVGVEFGVV